MAISHTRFLSRSYAGRSAVVPPLSLEHKRDILDALELSGKITFKPEAVTVTHLVAVDRSAAVIVQ